MGIATNWEDRPYASSCEVLEDFREELRHDPTDGSGPWNKAHFLDSYGDDDGVALWNRAGTDVEKAPQGPPSGSVAGQEAGHWELPPSSLQATMMYQRAPEDH